MRRPAQRYMAIFSKGREMAQMSFEARSDRGAARIAASFRYRDVGYLRPELDLESLLRFDAKQNAWLGFRHLDHLVNDLRRVA